MRSIVIYCIILVDLMKKDGNRTRWIVPLEGVRRFVVVVVVCARVCLFQTIGMGYLQSGDDSRSELLGSAVAAHVNGSCLNNDVISTCFHVYILLFTYSVGSDSLINSAGDSVGNLVFVQVSQHHDRGQEHSSGVGGVLVLKVKTHVTASLIWTQRKHSSPTIIPWLILLTGSNMAYSRPMLQPGTRPGPPIKPAPYKEFHH